MNINNLEKTFKRLGDYPPEVLEIYWFQNMGGCTIVTKNKKTNKLDTSDIDDLIQKKIPFLFENKIVCSHINLKSIKNSDVDFQNNLLVAEIIPAEQSMRNRPFVCLFGKINPESRSIVPLSNNEKKFLSGLKNPFPVMNDFGYPVLLAPNLVYRESRNGFAVVANCDLKTGVLTPLNDKSIITCISRNIQYSFEEYPKDLVDVSFECDVSIEGSDGYLSDSDTKITIKTIHIKDTIKIPNVQDYKLVELMIKEYMIVPRDKVCFNRITDVQISNLTFEFVK